MIEAFMCIVAMFPARRRVPVNPHPFAVVVRWRRAKLMVFRRAVECRKTNAFRDGMASNCVALLAMVQRSLAGKRT
jgi:hypothetical protein